MCVYREFAFSVCCEIIVYRKLTHELNWVLQTPRIVSESENETDIVFVLDLETGPRKEFWRHKIAGTRSIWSKSQNVFCNR